MDRDFGLLLKKNYDLMAKHGNHALQKMGLTFSQFHVLAYLYKKCPDKRAPLKKLETHFEVAQATMAGIVARLDGKGYVISRVCEMDKRVKIIQLTPEGEEKCQEALASVHQFHDKIESLYSEQELAQYKEYMERLYQFLVQADEQEQKKRLANRKTSG